MLTLRSLQSDVPATDDGDDVRLSFREMRGRPGACRVDAALFWFYIEIMGEAKSVGSLTLSPGGGFLLESTGASRVFTPEMLTDEQRMMREDGPALTHTEAARVRELLVRSPVVADGLAVHTGDSLALDATCDQVDLAIVASCDQPDPLCVLE